MRATLPVPVAEAGATPSPTGNPVFDETSPTSMWGTVMPVLREHGPFIAGGVLVLGTVLFLVVYSWVAPRPADE